MGKSQKLYEKAKKIIPGGTQLLSKRPEMFLPGLWPAYYSKAKGCEVWDLDGKKYIDMSYMGIGSCILGYADSLVDKDVVNAVKNGNMCTLNVPEEVELAKMLIALHPWAHMVRYSRTGGEAMSIAVRIARAKTGKDIVLFCGYHGWHDWYLASNLGDKKALDGHLLPGLNPLGVPRALKGTSYPFKYNDSVSFLKLVKKYKGRIAAIVVEPIRNVRPTKEFIKNINTIARKNSIVLIVDEITAGWRMNLGGAHLVLGIKPDIAVFGKGMSNGYPMSAIIGKRNVMNVAQETFISSTYWTDRIGPVSAISTINRLKKLKVSDYLNKIGQEIQIGWKILADKHGLKIKVSGIYPLGHFSFLHKDSLLLKTLFTQFMLEKGFLASTSFYASYAHKSYYIKKYLHAVDSVFYKISKGIKKNNLNIQLKGSVCHSGFARVT